MRPEGELFPAPPPTNEVEDRLLGSLVMLGLAAGAIKPDQIAGNKGSKQGMLRCGNVILQVNIVDSKPDITLVAVPETIEEAEREFAGLAWERLQAVAYSADEFVRMIQREFAKRDLTVEDDDPRALIGQYL